MEQPPAKAGVEVATPWTPAARQAAAFVLGIAVTLIGVRFFNTFSPVRPSERLAVPLPAYRVDLNQASAGELEQLPGIGPARAQKITDIRAANGPFATVDDLNGISGIGPGTVDRLRPHVRQPGEPNAPAKSTSLKPAIPASPINVNTATLEQLQALPGIGPKMAQRIIDHRNREPFQAIHDLRKVSGIGPKTMDKLKGLVCVSDDSREQ